MPHLEKYAGAKTRYTCPQCHDKLKFTRYVDEHGQYIDENVGRCDHESSCGYHYTPKQFFLDKGIGHGGPVNYQRPAPKVLPPPIFDYIPQATATATMKSYESNTLCIWLASMFGWEVALHLANLYRLGTTKAGECIYWQVGADGRISGGKIRAHNTETGKGLETSWAHYRMNLKGADGQKFNIAPCLFGAHLIATGKRIALVEGERTAIVMAHLKPELTWIATGGSHNFKPEILAALKGIPVSVFPDAGYLVEWKAKAMALNDAGYQFKMSTLLEKALQEGRAQKNDDFLDFIMRPEPQAAPVIGNIKNSARAEFLPANESATATAYPQAEHPTPEKEQHAPEAHPLAGHNGLERIIANLRLSYTGASEYTAEAEKVPHSAPNWLIGEIQAIRAYYATAQLPKVKIWIGDGEIQDVQAFVNSHLEYLSGTCSASVKRPYLDRLNTLKRLLDLGYPAPPF